MSLGSLNVGTAYVPVRADMGPFRRDLGGLGSSVGVWARTSVRGIAAVTTAAGLASAATLKLAGDYQASLNTFQAVSGATAKEMDKVSKRAKALGADMSLPATSAKDAADAMTELAKGGLSVRQSLAAAKGVLQLSAAAQVDNATAAAITARALNSFHLEGDKAVHVADLLAGAANASTGEITDMAMSLSQAGSQAHQSNVPIEDTVTAISELANAGILGSDAGTSLRVMLQRLNPQTAKAKDAMDDLGVSAFDADGNFRPLRDIIADYSDALDKLTPKQRQHALQVIFGTDAQRAANIILGSGVEKFDDLRDKVDKSGNAAKLANAKMKGFKGGLEGLKSQAETLAISLGTKLLPTAESVARQLGDAVGYLNDIATAKSPEVRAHLIFTGLDALRDKARDFLFGKTLAIDLDPRGRQVSFIHTKGFVDRIRDLFQQVLDADWSGPASKLGHAIGGAIRISAQVASAIVNAIAKAIYVHRKELADALGAVVKEALSSPGVWELAGVLLGGKVALAFTRGTTRWVETKFAALLTKQLAKSGFGRVLLRGGLVRGAGAAAGAAEGAAVGSLGGGGAAAGILGGAATTVFGAAAGGAALGYFLDQMFPASPRELRLERQIGEGKRFGWARFWAQQQRDAAASARDAANSWDKATGHIEAAWTEALDKAQIHASRKLPEISGYFGSTGQEIAETHGQVTKLQGAIDRLHGKDVTVHVQTLGSSWAETISSKYGSATLRGKFANEGFQRGGLIPGSGNGDKVPVLAEPGEGFLNKRAVAALGGPAMLERLNRAIPRFAQGGTVGDLPAFTATNFGRQQNAATSALRKLASAGLAKSMAALFALPAALTGGGSVHGLVPQVLRAIAFARGHGWHGSVISGFRTYAQQAALYAQLHGISPVALPGTSSHERGLAIDVSDAVTFDRLMNLAPPGARLFNRVPGDYNHFSVSGYDGGGILPHRGIGFNLSGRPERVLDPDETVAYERGRRGRPLPVTVVNTDALGAAFERGQRAGAARQRQLDRMGG